MKMPSTRNRVVCALGDTIDSLAPVSRFSSVDFPAFGAPTMATKPQRDVMRANSSWQAPVKLFRRQLLGRPFAARRAGAVPFADGDRYLEHRCVRRTGAGRDRVFRQIQTTLLRPLLQCRFGV